MSSILKKNSSENEVLGDWVLKEVWDVNDWKGVWNKVQEGKPEGRMSIRSQHLGVSQWGREEITADQ